MTTAPGSPPARRSFRRPAILVGLAVTTLMLVRLFAGGVVGLGDQGDGQRMMCSVGVADARAADPSGSAYVHTEWSAHRWYGETCGTDGEAYHSSEQ